MEIIKLSLLGEVRLEKAGYVVDVDTRKALAMAAYLAITQKMHSRDALAAFFWPDSDQSSGRGALRRTLSVLRKALGEEILSTSREQVELCPNQGLVVDALEFQQLLSETDSHHPEIEDGCEYCFDRLQRAASLYQGHFMEGFSLRDSLAFDDWQFQESEYFRRGYAQCLVKLGDAYLSNGDLSKALETARAWLSQDQLNESAHRRLMQLYTWDGQRSAAIRQYRICVRVLEEELGVAPMDETTSLYEAILQNQLIGPVQNTKLSRVNHAAINSATENLSVKQSADSKAPPDRIPMVGRSADLENLFQLYKNSINHGQLVIVRGEAGIGKTRLVEEFLTHVSSLGGKILRAQCYEGEKNLPYGAILDVLRDGLKKAGEENWSVDITSYELAEAARLLPELFEIGFAIPEPSLLEGPGAQTRFFDGVSAVLMALVNWHSAELSPGVIFIDDLQWVDDASFNLLAYLSRRITDQPVMLLAAWQDDSPVIDTRIRQLQTSAVNQDSVTTLSLERLTADELHELVRSIDMPPDLPDDWSNELYRLTEGVPLFFTAYIHAYQRETTSEQLENIPIDVQSLLQTRLDMLDEPARQLLQTAAVIGRSFEFDILYEASGRAEEESVVALEELELRGLVRQMAGALGSLPDRLQYGFSHEQMRLLVYNNLNLVRQRLLHRRVAEAMVRRVSLLDRPAFAGQIAYHFSQAGEFENAANYYYQAGEHARSIYANRDALGYFEAALAHGYPDRVRLYLAIGDLQTLMGCYLEAAKSFQTTAAHANAELIPIIEHRLGQVYDRLGNWDQAGDYFQSALSSLSEQRDKSLTIRVLADWSVTNLHSGNLKAAKDQAEKALILADGLNDAKSLAQVHNLLGILARHEDKPELAKEELTKSMNLAQVSGSIAAQTATANNLALVLGDLGFVDQAIECAEQALQLSIALGDRHREAAVRNNLADLLRAGGETEAAMGQLKRAVVIFADIGVDSGSWQPEIWKLVEW